MDLSFSPEHQRFRAEVRGWLAAHLERPWIEELRDPANGPDELFEIRRRWQARLHAAGYLGMDWPEAWGGRGATAVEKAILAEELFRTDAPPIPNVLGISLLGPALIHHGSEEQRQRFLPKMLAAEEIWCQGFSEPGAGSDLASLQTRAEHGADGWVVTGHKVWTTLAHFARWMILLARTDPTVGKYEGLSYFLFPMDAPGVTIQPLVKMTGEGGFNQVIFDKAPMPQEALLGREGQGWRIAMTTLTFERGASEGTGGGQAVTSTEPIRRLLGVARRAHRDGRPAAEDAVLRDRIVRLWIEEEAIRLSAQRGRIPALNAERPYAIPFMMKLVTSEFNQRVTDLACQLLGADAALWLGDPEAPDRAEWPRAYMNSFGVTIGGGTSEIQRNILGERVLGLPKSK